MPVTSYRFESTTDPARLPGPRRRPPGARAGAGHGAGRLRPRGAGGRRPCAAHPQWWVSVLGRDRGEEVVGVAMRTAPFVPHPMWVHLMPDDAAVALARGCTSAGDDVTAANGALPRVPSSWTSWPACAARRRTCTSTCGSSSCAPWSSRVRCAGAARAAGAATTSTWWPAGRRRSRSTPTSRPVASPSPASTSTATWTREPARAAACCGCGRSTACRCTSAPAPRRASVSSALGPVYTPREHRGHGYASALVAHLSRDVLDEGARPDALHRPGQPGVEPDLPGAGLRGGHRHREPAAHHTSTGLTTRPASTSSTASLIFSNG